jgi:hypothetical protein
MTGLSISKLISTIKKGCEPSFFDDAMILFAKQRDQTFFNDPVFWRHCHETFANDHEFVSIRIQEGSSDMGFALFRMESVRLMRKTMDCWVPLTYQASDFSKFVIDESRRGNVLNSILDSLQTLDASVLLSNVRSDDSVEISDKWKNKFRYSIQKAPSFTGGPALFDKVIKKKSLKRHTNRYSREGDFRVEHRIAQNDTELFDFFYDLHIERWAFESIESKFTRPKLRKLYSDLMSSKSFGCSKNQIVLSILYSNETVIAAHIGFTWGKTFLYHIPLMNLAEIDHSPGEVLMSELFKYAQQNGFEVFHLGYGDEGYKDRFSNSCENLETYFIPHSLTDKSILAARKLNVGERISKLKTTTTSALRGTAGKIIRSIRPKVIDFFVRLSNDEPASEVTYKALTFSDYVKLHRDAVERPYPLSREIYQRFRTGYKLYALEDSNSKNDGEPQFVSFAWAKSGAAQFIGELGKTVLAAEEVVWIIDCVTLQSKRGNGYYPNLIRQIAKTFSEQKACIYVDRTNIASTKGILKADFEKWGSIHLGRTEKFKISNDYGLNPRVTNDNN